MNNVIEEPQICLFDFDKMDSDLLIEKNHNITIASTGIPFKVDIFLSGVHKVRNYKWGNDIPLNLHEFNIFCHNLEDKEPVNAELRTKPLYKKDENTTYFGVTKQVNLFDIRPYFASNIGAEIDETLHKRPSIQIAFVSHLFTYKYHYYKEIYDYMDREEAEYLNFDIYENFSVISRFPEYEEKTGRKATINSNIPKNLQSILKKYQEKFVYHYTYIHPSKTSGNFLYKEPSSEPSENFIPLLNNIDNEIISYLETIENKKSIVMVLPEMDDKGNFLQDLLTDFLPSFVPEVFPYFEKAHWKNEEPYYLPHRKKIIEKEDKIEKEYLSNKEKIQSEIQENEKKYQSLHKLLIQTDKELVQAVIIFLEWLGFPNLRNMDECSDKKEEDIQIDMPDGSLLIIEVKGINGTSKDTDCNQVAKYMLRREQEKDKTEIYGLYIVNHQRYLPPLKREENPFTRNQIDDAEKERRGLLTTWQLFKLYYLIEDDLTSKKEAINDIRKSGFIQFIPHNLIEVGHIKKIYKNNYVVIIELLTNLEIDDELYFEDKGRYMKTKIESIEDNDKKVSSAISGIEVGLKLSLPIKKKMLCIKKKMKIK